MEQFMYNELLHFVLFIIPKVISKIKCYDKINYIIWKCYTVTYELKYIYLHIYSYQKKKCSLVMSTFSYKGVQKCKCHIITILFSMQKQLLYMLAHIYTLLENTEKFINIIHSRTIYIKEQMHIHII